MVLRDKNVIKSFFRYFDKTAIILDKHPLPMPSWSYPFPIFNREVDYCNSFFHCAAVCGRVSMFLEFYEIGENSENQHVCGVYNLNEAEVWDCKSRG